MDKTEFFRCKTCDKVFGLKHYLDEHIEKKHSKVKVEGQTLYRE